MRIWGLDWEYEFPEPVDWDDAARPYLEIFLTLHTPSSPDGLSRLGVPRWDEADFDQLVAGLGGTGVWVAAPAGRAGQAGGAGDRAGEERLASAPAAVIAPTCQNDGRSPQSHTPGPKGASRLQSRR